jgi:hypothetical protein
MHDQWLALNASRSESLYYLEYPSVLYRQHTGNVVGGRKEKLVTKNQKLKEKS